MKAKTGNKTIQPKIDYENKKLSVFYFLPLLLIVGFVPLIVYAKYIDLSGTTQSLYWTGQQQYLDFFSYWKSWWVVALTSIALLFYIILYKQKKLPFKNLKQYYIPLGTYALFVIISTMFAIDKQTALWGYVDMYQGMFVLLSYVFLTFLTINFVNNERDVNLFVKAFTFLMIVEGIIGVGQYFGFDFFQTEIGKSLILPGNLVVEDLSFSFGPKTIYGTLFNTNFVGSFATLMLPLSIAFLLGAKTKKQRIISGAAVILMLFVWIGCNSRAGYFGVAVAAVFALWLFRKLIIKHWRILVGLLMLLIILFFGLNSVSEGALLNRLNSFNIAKEIEKTQIEKESDYKLKNIIIDNNLITIETSSETLKLKIDENKVYFYDAINNELNIRTEKDGIFIDNPIYHRYRITIPESYPGIIVERSNDIEWVAINFYISEDGIKVLGTGNKLIDPNTSTTYKPLNRLGKIGSNRGYIWGHTIPLLKDVLIMGAGPDNFPLIFPQNDVVAKLNVGFSANHVIDKPHNMYLQIASNTGVGSLLAMTILWGMYIVSSIKLYYKTKLDSFNKLIGAACFISVVGYLSAGIFNDQVISVAPVFWSILGLGISLNYNYKLKMIK